VTRKNALKGKQEEGKSGTKDNFRVVTKAHQARWLPSKSKLEKEDDARMKREVKLFRGQKTDSFDENDSHHSQSSRKIDKYLVTSL